MYMYLGMAVNKLSMGSVNKMTYEDFIARFGNVVEHCSLCAAAVWRERPFRDAENLASCFCDFIDRLPINGKCHRFQPWSGVGIYSYLLYWRGSSILAMVCDDG